MTMGSERSSPAPAPSSSLSRPLHNFNLPGLRWGTRRHLGCLNPMLSGGRVDGYHDGTDVIGKRKEKLVTTTYHDVNHVIGKRKERTERENYDDDDDDSPADFRRRSVLKKSGLSSNRIPPLPLKTTTEYSRKIRRPPENNDDDGIAAVREKLMIDLQAETDRIKLAIFREGLDTEEEIVPPPPLSSSVAEPDSRPPWNLRTRRAACKEPAGNGFGSTSPVKAPMVESTRPNPSLLQPRLRSGGISGRSPSPESEKNDRPKFSVALSRREIDEDVLAITGRKPHRRPKKRPKHVQKTLDALFPGLWLTEINADMYKVPKTR